MGDFEAGDWLKVKKTTTNTGAAKRRSKRKSSKTNSIDFDSIDGVWDFPNLLT